MRSFMKNSENLAHKKVGTSVAIALLLWLALVIILGAENAFSRGPGAAPLPILAGFLIPIIVFFATFWTVKRFRDFLMSIDLPVIAGIQAWRFAGLGFLALYAYGVLPGLFAWPAGVGDMFIGATAPLVILALRRRPAFAASKLFWIWNLLGVLDLIVAVSLGATCAVLGIGISAGITTFPMGTIPLVVIPTFLVPIFLMLHFSSLLQAQRVAASRKVCSWTEPTLLCEPVEAT